MSQFALPLDWRQRNEPLPFIAGEANRLALRHLDHPSLWPVRTSLLVGPRKSGKSLLGRQFAKRTGARLIDNAQDVAEDELFHAWNRAQDEGRFQLLIAEAPPPLWKIGLPDLASRIAATPMIAIAQPDEALLVAIIAAQLERHGIMMDDDARHYLATRIRRDFVTADCFVDQALAHAAGRQRPLTIPQIRVLLSKTMPAVIDAS